MAVQTQLFFMATSKVKEIRHGGSVTFEWGKYGPWTKFKNPTPKSKKKVKYNAKTKDAWNTTSGKYGNTGGRTVYGTAIPAKATRVIDGVERQCDVRYYQRGKIIYTRPKSLKSNKKMYKTTYNNSYPYQYRLQYKDKPVITTPYTTYSDGMEYIFFSDHYYDTDGQSISTSGHLMHPQTCSVSYSDCRRNYESTANNSDGRDNKGSYVMSNVRANIVTLTLEWNGISEQQGEDLLNTLNPSKNSKNEYPYINAQYLDPATGKAVVGTFFASQRDVEKYANGTFKSISVTLTEV